METTRAFLAMLKEIIISLDSLDQVYFLRVKPTRLLNIALMIVLKLFEQMRLTFLPSSS